MAAFTAYAARLGWVGINHLPSAPSFLASLAESAAVADEPLQVRLGLANPATLPAGENRNPSLPIVDHCHQHTNVARGTGRPPCGPGNPPLPHPKGAQDSHKPAGSRGIVASWHRGIGHTVIIVDPTVIPYACREAELLGFCRVAILVGWMTAGWVACS